MARPKAILPIHVEDRGINMLVYSEPGVGKTVFAGTSPKALIIAPPTDNPDSAAIMGSTADVVRPEDWNEMDELEEYLRHEGHETYEWVWLDTITLMQEITLEGIMVDLHAAKPHRLIYKPDRGEYGENMNRISMFCRHVKALPMNFGICAHIMRTEDDEGRVLYMPQIQGKGMPEKICGYMGAVGYMRARTKGGEIERSLTFRKQARFYAKDLYGGALGQRLIDPTVPQIEELIKAKLEAAPKRPATKARKTTKKTTKKTTRRS